MIPTPPHRVPASAERFVYEAQRITNERDIAAARKVFARDALWVSIIDGMIIEAHGITEIDERWQLMCRFMRARRMTVTKRLMTSDDRLIVNEWSGSLDGRDTAVGIEYWIFDDKGSVTEQRLYGFLDAHPDTSLRQSLRMLSSYPRTALAFARARVSTAAAAPVR